MGYFSAHENEKLNSFISLFTCRFLHFCKSFEVSAISYNYFFLVKAYEHCHLVVIFRTLNEFAKLRAGVLFMHGGLTKLILLGKLYL